MQVRALQGDTVEQLCWRHQQRRDTVEATLELNRGLAALGEVLPAGTLVELAEPAAAATQTEVIQLWT